MANRHWRRLVRAGFRMLTVVVCGVGASAPSAGRAEGGSASPVRAVREATTASRWAELMPPIARRGHTAVYDPLRDRMLVFGGADAGGPYRNDVWEATLSGKPDWTRVVCSGTPPEGRLEHAAIYDPVRDRLVVFGGMGSTVVNNQVWALTLSGSPPAWTQLSPTGTPPSARSGQTAIYDAVRDRMLVFAGNDGTDRNDLWALSLSGSPAWTLLAPSGTPPSSRSDHSAVYDPVRDRMLVFGGRNTSGGTSPLGDLWALSLSGTPAWAPLAPAGTPPSARHSHAAVYDAAWDRMLIVAGYDTKYVGDTWVLSLPGTPSWAKAAPPTALSSRGSHTAVLDPVRRQMLVFGGHTGGNPSDNSLMALRLSGVPVWTTLATAASMPRDRTYTPAAHDALRDRMLIFGGLTAGGRANDVWSLAASGNPAWSNVPVSGTPPANRFGHSTIYDPVRDRLLVFGGFTMPDYANDVWSLTLSGTPTWTRLTPTGGPPPGRQYHCAVYDPVRDRMVVFGGYYSTSGPQYLNDVWALSLSGSPAWTQLAPSGTPPSARYSASAIYDPGSDRVVVFGGRAAAVNNELWGLSLAGVPAWSQMFSLGQPPAARAAHTAVYDSRRQRMLVFGGWNLSTPYLNDVQARTLTGTPQWYLVTTTGTAPTPRYSHAAAYDSAYDRMLMFGGADQQGTGSDEIGDTWSLWFPGVVDAEGPQPVAALRLALPRPNPAAGGVRVSFALPRAAHVRLCVYDAAGSRVATLVDEGLPAGEHPAQWNGTFASGRRCAAGLYLLELTAGGERVTRRLTLMR
ncbi:MAG: hypothetical protein HZB25_13905 [Candidatus Eisenbacteria bacterium]|nr:hypothetical protein [Candidatus Eisenbacteria bacterium]